jgi:hypothetical protein
MPCMASIGDRNKVITPEVCVVCHIMSPGMKAPNAVRHPCKKRPPGHIKANIRGTNPTGRYLLLCRVQRSQATYRVAPHGIGGAATHSRRIVVVGITIVVDITEIGRRTGI